MMHDAAADGGPGSIQTSLRFLHEGSGPMASMHAYDIRLAIKDGLPLAPMDAITVHTSPQTILLASRTPLSSQWMQSNLGDLMGCVADIAAKELAVTPVQTKVANEETGDRHLYTIPRLIVARPKPKWHWGNWRQADLEPELRDELHRIITNSIRQELSIWGCTSNASITLLSDGRPMPICPDRGPRGMARLGVTFSSTARLDGGLFAGLYTLMGHGAVHRGGVLPKATKGALQ